MSDNRSASPRAAFWKKAAKGAAVGALLAAGATGMADAKSVKASGGESKLDAANAKIEQLEQELHDLSAQVADLKASTANDTADIRATQASVPTISLDNGRPTLASADGKIKFAVRGMAQFDGAHYFESDKRNLDLNSGTNFRRARLGVEGSWKDWSYALTGEFGGSGAEAATLNQAYVEYAGLKPGFLANPVRLRVGAWAQPANLEDATSNTEALFLERPGIAELVRSLAAGDGRSGFGFNANGDRWFLSGTWTGDLVGQGSASTTPISDEQTGYLARAAYALLKGPNHALHIGANLSGVNDPQDTGAGPATTKSLRLRERPELRVDDTRLIDTAAIPAEGLIAYGGELGANWKNFYLAAEYAKIDLDRSGALSDPSFSGWYVQGAWTLTGEQHQWNAANGGFRGIRPANPFDPKNGKWGAWEIAARYSDLNLNYHEGVQGLAAPADGVRGGEQKISTAGLNWYPNNLVRFQLEYLHGDINKPTTAAVQPNNNFDAVALRSQFAF